jgi:hypothetical protein
VCKGGATTLQPWIFRLIRNAEALAATSPTLLFGPKPESEPVPGTLLGGRGLRVILDLEAGLSLEFATQHSE